MTFTFREVSDEETLKSLYKFRCQILCEEQKVFDINNYPEKEESDQYDPYSIHFAGFDKNNEVASYCRFILNSPIGYPTQNTLIYDTQYLCGSNIKLGEVSRIHIHKKYRSLQESKIFFDSMKKFVLLKMYQNNIQYTFGALEKKFIRLLQIHKIQYEPIGEAQNYLGFEHYPCVLYAQRLLNDNPMLEKYILE